MLHTKFPWVHWISFHFGGWLQWANEGTMNKIFLKHSTDLERGCSWLGAFSYTCKIVLYMKCCIWLKRWGGKEFIHLPRASSSKFITSSPWLIKPCRCLLYLNHNNLNCIAFCQFGYKARLSEAHMVSTESDSDFQSEISSSTVWDFLRVHKSLM